MDIKYSLIIQPKAEEDLDRIYDYIVNQLHNKKAAQDLESKFFEVFEQIENFPLASPYVKTEKDYHKAIVENYLIIYKVFEDKHKCIVFRVLYGRMDYFKFL